MSNSKRVSCVLLALAVTLVGAAAGRADVKWDFENGNDHGFILWSVVPSIPGEDDPNTAGDEALTGGLPEAGLAWTIGSPNQFDGLLPVKPEGCHDDSGVLQYGPCNNPFGVTGEPPYDFTNARGQSGYLNTYNLNQWGDTLHAAANDQIATSRAVVLDANAVLTVWAVGGSTASWAGTKMAPALDPDPNQGYVSGSAGIAVLSAEDGSLLASLFIAAEGAANKIPDEFSLDLSAFEGQKIVIEVVDAGAGGWGFLAIDEIFIANALEADVIWDFEKGNDHGFALWSAKAATPAPDDPNTAGDESITGVGGDNGLPGAGVAWTIGLPDVFDGQAPAVVEGCHVVDGLLKYGPCNDPFGAASGEPPYDFTNGRGQSGYLGTYHLSQWGDGLHSATNDQIATSRVVLLNEGAELTVWAFGNTTASWAGTRIAPALDPDPAEGYVTGSGGVAVLSAEDGSLLASLLVAAEGGNGNMPAEFKLDLSAFAGQKVVIEVVDAFAGGWGWLVVDEIKIANARALRTAAVIVSNTDLALGFDQAQKDRLEMLGYEVMLATGSDVKNDLFTLEDAQTYDVLIVSESISSGDVDELIGVSVPMMHEESYGWSRHFFTAGLKRAWTTPVNGTLDIVDDTHPIVVAAGLSVGAVPFFTDPNVALTTDLVTSLVPGAMNLVQTTDADGNDVTCIFAIEAGTELANASLAANRIVGFSIPGDNSHAADAMTDEVWALFDAAIAWLDPVPW